MRCPCLVFRHQTLNLNLIGLPFTVWQNACQSIEPWIHRHQYPAMQAKIERIVTSSHHKTVQSLPFCQQLQGFDCQRSVSSEESPQICWHVSHVRLKSQQTCEIIVNIIAAPPPMRLAGTLPYPGNNRMAKSARISSEDTENVGLPFWKAHKFVIAAIISWTSSSKTYQKYVLESYLSAEMQRFLVNSTLKGQRSDDSDFSWRLPFVGNLLYLPPFWFWCLTWHVFRFCSILIWLDIISILTKLLHITMTVLFNCLSLAS